MARLIPFPNPMRPDVFVKIVRDRAAFPNMVVHTGHSKERMLERGITARQVLNVLRKGDIAEGPRRNEEKGSYEGVLRYHGTGREITVVCAILQSQLTVIAVTVY